GLWLVACGLWLVACGLWLESSAEVPLISELWLDAYEDYNIFLGMASEIGKMVKNVFMIRG
ncbi:MAG: hypothetical protein WCT04_23570, partial [Planctomycetota bacterium]